MGFEQGASFGEGICSIRPASCRLSTAFNVDLVHYMHARDSHVSSHTFCLKY